MRALIVLVYLFVVPSLFQQALAAPGGGCCRAQAEANCCAAQASNDQPGPRGRGRGPRWQRQDVATPESDARPLPHKRELMQDAHALVFNHMAITRTIEDIPNGVKTITTTSDPALLSVLQRHPREMGELYKQGGRVRAWDPLFTELSAVADLVTMEMTNLENGVAVTATSEDEEVVKLIRAHARKVSEFVRRGRDAMREDTPLPQDYDPTKVGAPPSEEAPNDETSER